MVRLTGTGLLADDLYLLAHHDVTGRAYLQPRALGIGLAGGLLAELVFADAIRVGGGHVTQIGGSRAHDRLGQQVLTVLARDREWRPAGEWLVFLAARAADHVAARLADSGYLSQVSSRRPWRAPRWVPVSSDCAFAPLGRMQAVLDPARTAATPDVALAGLAVACGLGPRLLPYGPAGARRHRRADRRQRSHRVQEAYFYACSAHRCCWSGSGYSINAPAMSHWQHQMTTVVVRRRPPAATQSQRCCWPGRG